MATKKRKLVSHIRARKPFSFRGHLAKQGVTTGDGFRYHMEFVHTSMKSCSGVPLNLRRYKVDPKNPNGGTYHG
jgi:hypothetical protein